MPFTLLRNGLYTERYTDHLREYLEDGEIMGAAGNGGISAASRQDYAAAAAAAILQDERANRTYELGGPAFGLPKLARVISEVTGAKVTYRDLPAKEYAHELHGAGLDEATARFVAAVDASIARGELETSSADLTSLLGRAATGLAEVVRAAHACYRDPLHPGDLNRNVGGFAVSDPCPLAAARKPDPQVSTIPPPRRRSG